MTDSAEVKELVDFVLRLHEHLEDVFVMRHGVHDMGLVESAVSSPFQTFGGEDLYPTVFDKAAQLCYALAKDHGFEDGNKRTGLHVMISYLYMCGIKMRYNQKELEELVINLVEDKISTDDLKGWLVRHSVPQKKIHTENAMG